MGASQDKRKSGSGGFSFGNSNKTKDEKAKATAKTAVITVIVVALLFAGALFINSDFLRQNMAAVTIDNVKYSITDFNYYYQNVYMQYYQSVSGTGDLASSMLPDTQKSLKSQVYDEETGETWAEFFERMALEQMKADNEIYVEAQKAGYQMSEADKKSMEDSIASVQQTAYTYGYTDLGKYLKAVYGKGMDEAAYRKAAERTYLIDSYSNYIHDSYTYTPDQIESYYTQYKDSFDTFTYRYYLVKADDINKDDYSDDTAYQTAKDAAVEAAGVKAKEYADEVKSETDFITGARAYDPETYNEDDSTLRVYQGELLGSTYGDWLKDASRQDGDVSTFKSTNGYYVVYYIGRSDNHYTTVNVQQIVVKPETINESDYAEDEDTTAYDEAVAKAKTTAEETANKILNEWSSTGATQDQMTQLTTNYADQISTDDSKLLENVYKEQLPADVTAWIYDSARKTGDYTMVYNESTGYHILYFVGPGKQYSDVLADSKKRDEDLQAWKDSLTVVEPKATWLMTLAK